MTDIIHTITKNRESWPPVGEWIVCLAPPAKEQEEKKYQDEFGRIVSGICVYSISKKLGEKQVFVFFDNKISVENMLGWEWMLLPPLLPLFEGTKVLVDKEPSEEMIERGVKNGLIWQDENSDEREIVRQIYKAMLEGQ